MPPKTLEEARNQPGRREQIEGITKQNRVAGASSTSSSSRSPITGRVMGKGVVASFSPAGRREGLSARLRRDGQPLRRPLRRLHRLRSGRVRARRDRGPPTLPTFPGTPALRACSVTVTTPRPGSCSTPTRGRTSSGSSRSSGGARIQLPHRHRARDDVAQEGKEGSDPRGRHQALSTTSISSRSSVRCSSTSSNTARRSASTCPTATTRTPRPARAELPLRPPRQDRRQHHDLPPDLRRGGPQARPAADLHAQAVHGRVGQRPPPPLHPHRRRGQQRLPRQGRAGGAVATPPVTSSAACSSTSAR